MATVIASVLVFAAAIIGMAVGVVLSNRCLRGSCGGLSSLPGEAGQSLCESCSTTKAAENEPARAHAEH